MGIMQAKCKMSTVLEITTIAHTRNKKVKAKNKIHADMRINDLWLQAQISYNKSNILVISPLGYKLLNEMFCFFPKAPCSVP